MTAQLETTQRWSPDSDESVVSSPLSSASSSPRPGMRGREGRLARFGALRLPTQLTARVRHIHLLLVLVNAALIVPQILLSDAAPRWRGAALVLLAACAAAWWRMRDRDGRASMADALEATTFVVLVVALQNPVITLGVVYTALIYRALCDSHRRAALRVAMSVAGVAVGAALVPDLPPDQQPLVIVQTQAGALALTALSIRLLAVALDRHDQVMRRERVLSSAAVQFMTTTDVQELAQMAARTLAQLIGGASPVRIRVWVGDADAPTTTGLAGEVPQPPASPAGERSHRMPLTGRHGVIGGVVIEGLRGDLDPGAGDTIMLATRQISLALENAQAQNQLVHRALHDRLTELPNREMMLLQLERQAAEGRGAALLFIDLDDFKLVNDTLGHGAGDELLVHVGRRIRGCLKAEDMPSRLGGDEFAVVLVEVPDAVTATRIGERLLTALDQPFMIAGRRVQVRASIGAAFTAGPQASRELLRQADVAMYAAKARGKGQVVLFDDEMDALAGSQLGMREDLAHAIEHGDLELHYQPLVALGSGEVMGVEALVRWRRAGDLVPPGDFIPLAESSGLIVPLGRWVMQTACREIAALRTEHPHLTVSVNVSPLELVDPRFPETVQDILSSNDLPAGALTVEVTEGQIMGETGPALGALAALRTLGIQVALDDFGTGYSSLSYLSRVPCDVVKIDRSFVVAAAQPGADLALLQGIVALSSSLGLKTLAEGIETAEQGQRLTSLGCQFAQGYFFARPLPLDDLRELLVRPPRRVPPAETPPSATALDGRIGDGGPAIQDIWAQSSNRLADLARVDDVEALFESAFASLDRGMMMIDLEGRILRANSALADLLGRSVAGLIHVRFHELLSPLDAMNGELAMGRMVAGEVSHHEGTYEVLLPDGSSTLLTARGSLYLGAEETPLCVIVEVVPPALSTHRTAVVG